MMADETTAERAAALLHELAEALQATGNYLGALRHGAGDGRCHLSGTEIIARAHTQCMRAQDATRQLRDRLHDRDRAED